jgi:hypothetical protein
MSLSKILKQVFTKHCFKFIILISRDYIIVCRDMDWQSREFGRIFSNISRRKHYSYLFDFNNKLIKSYENTNDDNAIRLHHDIISKCILIENVNNWYRVPSYIVSEKITHLFHSNQLKFKNEVEHFERLCEQNRISGLLMKYWEFDCLITYK